MISDLLRLDFLFCVSFFIVTYSMYIYSCRLAVSFRIVILADFLSRELIAAVGKCSSWEMEMARLGRQRRVNPTKRSIVNHQK